MPSALWPDMSVVEQILMVYKYIVLFFFRTENPELFVE